MKRVAIFVDVNNLYYCVSRKYEGRKLNYGKYLEKAISENQLHRAFAYGVHGENEAENNFIQCLQHYGFETKYKKAKRFDWNVGITTDVIRILDKVDIVILGSSNPSLIHLIERIKEQGVLAVVLACGIPKEIKEEANIWIEIDQNLLQETIRMERKEENAGSVQCSNAAG